MKQTGIIMAFFLVLTIAVFGCLIIFEVMSTDKAMGYMLKSAAAIVLLGVCSILLTFLFKSDSN
jgi:hypothetical protein